MDAAAMLSPAERSRLAGLDSRAARTFLSGRLLLRQLAGELLDVDPAAVPLTARCPDCGGEHGRPAIAGSGLRVGLSHTADVVVAVAAWDVAVGVDVERAAGSTERFDAIEALTGRRSLGHWTRVEAVLKADGRGLRVDPGDVHVEGDEAAVSGSPARYGLRSLEIDGTVAALAIEL